jgi:hypothetical protein
MKVRLEIQMFSGMVSEESGQNQYIVTIRVIVMKLEYSNERLTLLVLFEVSEIPSQTSRGLESHSLNNRNAGETNGSRL